MVKAADTLIADGLALPLEDRQTVVEALMDSIANEVVELAPEQAAILTKRIESLERGDVQPIPGNEVDARIRKLLSRD